MLPLPALVHFWVSRVSSNRREPFAALAPRLPKPESVNKARPDALFSGGFRLQHGRARFRDFFVLGRAFRAAYANRANHLAVVNDRHGTLQRCKVRQRGHRETAFVDRVLKVLRGLLENRRRAGFSDGDIRAGGKASFRPDEVEQITAVVHHRDGRASAVVFRIFRGGFANLLCAFKRKLVLYGDVTLVNVIVRNRKSRSGKKSEECE